MRLKSLFIASAVGMTCLTVQPAFADSWTVDPAQSTLGFEVVQGGGPLTGTFDTWNAGIEFDPDAPETANISAVIQPASATTGNPQFDGTLPGADWFDAAGFPAAEFRADRVSRVDGNRYSATGSLTIKGISQPVTLDFTLEIDGDLARAKGTATLSRMAYQLGTGVGTDTVGDAVTVTLDLVATR